MSEISGERIRKLRKKKGLSQAKLQALINGIDGMGSKSTISGYEKGGDFTTYTLLRLSEALDCEPDYLLGRMDHPTSKPISDVVDVLPLSIESLEYLERLKEWIDISEASGQKGVHDEAVIIAGAIDSVIKEMLADYKPMLTSTKASANTTNLVNEYIKSLRDAHIDRLSASHVMELEPAKHSIVYFKDQIGKALSNAVDRYCKSIAKEVKANGKK